MVICTECGEPTRIAHERVPMGTDQKMRTRRVCKRCGKPIEEHTRE
jgi:large subunit ribosomal protein L24